MFLGVVKRVFSHVYGGGLSTVQAQKLIHLFCTSRGLNPALEAPITTLMLTQAGQENLQVYEEFLMKLSWIMAKLAAKEVSIQDAVINFNENIKKLKDCRESIFTDDEVLNEYFNEHLWSKNQNIY